MARFFVSYSRSDKDEVSKAVSLLSAAGHEVWWDNDIPVIADWWATILTHIEWCEVFIFVVSEKSIQSDYCLDELKYANERQRPILPFILQDPSTLHLPSFLPHRAQWLLYDGDPARMLAQINTAYKAINWNLHKVLDVPRPPEPNKGGKSIARMYQQARQLANEQRFVEAKLLFQDIKGIDFEQWGTDCDEWLARLVNYEQIVELVQDASTLEHARGAWQKYIRRYGDDFDPYPVKPLVMKPVHHRNTRILLTLAGVGVIILVLIATRLSSGDPSEVTIVPTFTETIAASETQIAVAPTSLPTEMPAPTIAPSDTDEPTNTPSPTLTPSPTSTLSITPNLILTAQLLDAQFTQTTDAFLREQSVTHAANMTLAALSWTPSFSLTPTPTSTLTHTVRPTDRPSATLRPTQRATSTPNNSEVTINVASANLRSGPGTNYSVVGTASQNEVFSIVARTTDSGWFLIALSNNNRAWISSGVVTRTIDENFVPIAATIPPSPVSVEMTSRATQVNGQILDTFTNSGPETVTIWLLMPNGGEYCLRFLNPSETAQIERGQTYRYFIRGGSCSSDATRLRQIDIFDANPLNVNYP